MPFPSKPYYTLLSNAGAGNGADVQWPGGRGAVFCEGTFGGATVKLQAKTQQGTYVDVGTDVSFTSAGVGGFELPECVIRMVTSGGTPSALYASCQTIPVFGG